MRLLGQAWSERAERLDQGFGRPIIVAEEEEFANNKPNCQSRQSARFDVIVLIDNSCGLSSHDCDDLLHGVGSIISLLLNPSTRVQTMQIETSGAAKIIVGFVEDDYQQDASEYIEQIRQRGQCIEGGDGHIDLVQANGMVDNKFDKVSDTCPDYWYII